MFWFLFIVTLYLILTSPSEFASFVRDTNSALLRFLRSFRDFFNQVYS